MTTTQLDIYRQRYPRRDDESADEYLDRLSDQIEADRSQSPDVRSSDQKNRQRVVR